MLSEADRKALTEYIGECWHEPKPLSYQMWVGGRGSHCYTCVKCGCNYPGEWTPRTFTTPADLHAVYSAMVRKGEWIDFYRYSWLKGGGISGGNNHEERHVSWLFCLDAPEQIPARMKMVVEFIKNGNI